MTPSCIAGRDVEAEEVRAAIAARLQECRLELHPEKTTVVYCKDDDRRGNYPIQKFDFLGYTFRPRKSKNRRGKCFINFSPAVADKAVKAIRDEIRQLASASRSDKSIEDLSRLFNPILRGWLRYYGRYYRSAVYLSVLQLDRSAGALGVTGNTRSSAVVNAARHIGRARSRRAPKLFAHWQMECGTVPLWEPYERRRSRTVLRGPRGEIPRAYLPVTGTSTIRWPCRAPFKMISTAHPYVVSSSASAPRRRPRARRGKGQDR